MEQIANALLAVQKAIKDPAKDSTNPHFGNTYVGLSALVQVVRPALNDEGIVLIQTPSMEDGLVTVETTFLHVSGETVSGKTYSPVSKQDPQGVGSAITYLRRYALMAMLGLGSEQDDDGNAASTPPGESGPATDRRDVPVFVLANAFGVCTDLDVEAEELAKILTSCGVAVETRKARSGKDVEWAKDIALPVVIAAQKNSDEREKRDIDELRKMADFLLGEKQVSDTRTDDGPPPPTDEDIPF